MVRKKINRTALITGATSGIGLSFSRLLAREGWSLILAARNENKLRELAGELAVLQGARCDIMPVDLSEPNGAFALFQQVQNLKLNVDALINNAGSTLLGKFAETDLSSELGMIQLNLVSLVQLTKLFLPAMIHQKSGHILNVSSVAGFYPGPQMAIYYATKSFVLSFSEALAVEVKGLGVTVTALCPGTTRTQVFQSAGIRADRVMRSRLTMDAKSVAEIGYRGMMKGKSVVIPGWVNRILVFGLKLPSRSFVARFIGGLIAQLQN